MVWHIWLPALLDVDYLIRLVDTQITIWWSFKSWIICVYKNAYLWRRWLNNYDVLNYILMPRILVFRNVQSWIRQCDWLLRISNPMFWLVGDSTCKAIFTKSKRFEYMHWECLICVFSPGPFMPKWPNF